MKRRELLSKFVKGSFYLGVAPFAQKVSALSFDESDTFDCIVLGAGAAGLTAARNLMESPFLRNKRKILVLEGSSRIGGRIYTNRDVFANPVEFGAEFIHRSPGTTPIWDEVNRYGVEIQRISKISNALMYNANSNRPITKSLIETAGEYGFLNSMKLYGKLNASRRFDMSLAEWVQSQNHNDNWKSEFEIMSVLGHVPGNQNEISLSGFNSDQYSTQLSEHNEYYVKSGYVSLFENLAKNLNIKYNSRVESIEWSTAGVTITCTGGEVYRAKTAICTFSIGMLKSGRVEFKPGLPDSKIQALSVLKSGHHSKVIMQFDQRFWPKDMPMFHRSDNLRRVGKTYFTLFYGDHQKPPTLTALLLGDDAAKIRNWSLEETVQNICVDLSEAFPEAGQIERLVSKNQDGIYKAFRQQWMDDEFALGGNAFLTYMGPDKGSDVSRARTLLAQPDTGPLFWAGEATSTDIQPGSVHGAHLSGIRAAKQAQYLLSNNRIYQLSRSSTDYEIWRSRNENPKVGFGNK